MRVIVELNSGDVEGYSEDLFCEVAEDAIINSGRVKSADDVTITISTAFVSPEEIRRVNGELRDKDRVTDVISVGDYSDDKDITKEKGGDVFLGEIILCYNYIVQNASENDDTVDHELFTVYAHGILHLLGFRHGEEMYKLQDAVAEKFSGE